MASARLVRDLIGGREPLPTGAAGPRGGCLTSFLAGTDALLAWGWAVGRISARLRSHSKRGTKRAQASLPRTDGLRSETPPLPRTRTCRPQSDRDFAPPSEPQ